MHDFSTVLRRLKTEKGLKATREGWNGKDMFIFLVDGSVFQVSRAPLNEFYEDGTVVTYRPHLDMKYADGTIGVWLASQSDMLMEDWVFV